MKQLGIVTSKSLMPGTLLLGRKCLGIAKTAKKFSFKSPCNKKSSMLCLPLRKPRETDTRGTYGYK
jgi:hypothetical protein